MVDYNKLETYSLSHDNLSLNSLLDFGMMKNIGEHGELIPIVYNGETQRNKEGEIRYKTPYKDAFYNGLQFKLYNTGKTEIKGSMHKYFNSGAHNYNDFTINSFIEVVNDLQRKFNIDPKDCIIRNLEIGLNITPPIDTTQFLDNCFLHSTMPFEYGMDRPDAKYKQVKHIQFYVKLYNKGLQYKNEFELDTEILRFELKYNKMKTINDLGIFTLQDLKEFDFTNFKRLLFEQWNKILYYDNTIKSNREIKLLNYSNPNYWKGLLNGSRSNLGKQRGILRELTRDNSDNIQLQTQKIMSDKIDYLCNGGVSIYPLYIESKPTPQRICLITKLSISMQRCDSNLLSHSGIKYYYEKDYKVYQQLKRKYLSNKWNNDNFDIQIKEIAHNIRNTKNNQIIKQKRIYPQEQLNFLNTFNV